MQSQLGQDVIMEDWKPHLPNLKGLSLPTYGDAEQPLWEAGRLRDTCQGGHNKYPLGGYFSPCLGSLPDSQNAWIW